MKRWEDSPYARDTYSREESTEKDIFSIPDSLTTEERKRWNEARNKAMDLISFAERTEGQLRDKMKEKGYGSQEIEQAVDYVKQGGFLDDERYGKYYLFLHGKQKSAEKLRVELMRKKLNKELIEQLLDQREPEDEQEALFHAIEKKTRNWDVDVTRKEKEKLFASLLRQGFRSADIRRYIDPYSDGWSSVNIQSYRKRN